MVGYDEGLTEYQDNEYYTDIVEVRPVEKMVMITEWEEIKHE